MRAVFGSTGPLIVTKVAPGFAARTQRSHTSPPTVSNTASAVETDGSIGLCVTQSHRKVDAKRRQELLRHLDQIENTVVKIVVPLAFADLFYTLRGHISAVRESLLADLVLVDPSDSEGSAERRECSACVVTPPNANTQVRVIEMPIRDQ